MTDRIIDLANGAARLKVRYDNLVIERQDAEPVSLPLADVGVLIVSHPQVSFTHAVLSGLTAAGGAFIACDRKHMPAGMLLPLKGHFVQTERFAQQANASRPTSKRLWQQIVRAKIRNQAAVFKDVRGEDSGLSALIRQVRSGDPANIEARASRRYWPALFGDDFRRHEDDGPNAVLNYGYAVLRAIVARAICAAGLHPSLGVHHHNRYDTFCLADDLMEPMRPIIDRAAAALVNEHGADLELDRDVKAALLTALTGRVGMRGERRTLFDAAARSASSLAAVFADKRKELDLPEL